MYFQKTIITIYFHSDLFYLEYILWLSIGKQKSLLLYMCDMFLLWLTLPISLQVEIVCSVMYTISSHFIPASA